MSKPKFTPLSGPGSPSPARAYSYLRFSTPEQAQGDSVRRQIARAEDYCKRHGLTLDTELALEDRGVSAWRGKNLTGTSKLAAFLAAIEAGDVPPGSVLLVEYIDRLSRDTVDEASDVLKSIVRKGVDVVTLNDGSRYDRKALQGFGFIKVAVEMWLASLESTKKSERVLEARATKRAGKAAMGYGRESTALTRNPRQVPGWIHVEPTGKRVPIAERVKVVKRMFTMCAEGHGAHAIARAFNAEKIPTFGRAKEWREGYIHKALRSTTVLGTLVHKDGTIEGYYPPAIDRETWDRTRPLVETAHRAPGTSSLAIKNILAGVGKCPHCGGAMTRVWKGSSPKNGEPRLVCAWAKVGGVCQYVSVSLPAIEAALRRVARDPLPAAGGSLADDLKAADAALEAVTGIVNGLVLRVEQSASKALMERLKAREAERDALAAEYAALERQAAESDTKLMKRRAQRYRDAMTAKPFDVRAANVALREMVSKVVVDYPRGVLVVHWRHDGETEIAYTL